MGICPYCEKAVISAHVEVVTLLAGLNSWNGISYACPSCHHVLGLGFDPAALQADIVQAVLEVMGKE